MAAASGAAHAVVGSAALASSTVDAAGVPVCGTLLPPGATADAAAAAFTFGSAVADDNTAFAASGDESF